MTILRRLAALLALAAVATLWATGDVRTLSTNLLPTVVVDAEGWSR